MRNHRLDVLRGVAVLVTVLHHTHLRWVEQLGWTRPFFLEMIRAGWLGVVLFFVLSGFLVSGLLFQNFIEEKKLFPFRFLLRRGLKIYPGFYFCLLVFAGVKLATKQFQLTDFLKDALFVQNYFGGVLSHTWSIAVEEHFYLLLLGMFLLLVRGGAKQPFQRLPLIFGVVALVSLAGRFATLGSQPNFYRAHIFPTHLRLDALFFGVLIAYYFHFHRTLFNQFLRRYVAQLSVLSAMLIAPGLLLEVGQSDFLITVGLTTAYLGCGILISLTFQYPPIPGRTADSAGRAIAYIGRHSYSIYLWHWPLLFMIFPRIEKVFGARLGIPGLIVCYLVASLALGILFSHLIEFPVLRWRDRVFPSAKGSSGPLEDDRPRQLRHSRFGNIARKVNAKRAAAANK